MRESARPSLGVSQTKLRGALPPPPPFPSPRLPVTPHGTPAASHFITSSMDMRRCFVIFFVLPTLFLFSGVYTESFEQAQGLITFC